jgi:hypothetical protein
MSTNLVQALIDQTSDMIWLEILQRDYKINAVPDPTGRLVSLKYDQIESPMAEPIVQQCRGMVVDVRARKVVAWPYNKFWNLGETLAAPVDWATARVLEKLDGSLMILYWDPHLEEWTVASSGHPTAGGGFSRSGDETTFAHAFWSLFRAAGASLEYAARDVTYMLELCASENRIVVQHATPRLVLHGARKLTTGREFSHEELHGHAAVIGVRLVQTFPLADAAGVTVAAQGLDPVAQEGFVVVDANFHRVKVKSPRYVQLHHMRGATTTRRVIDLWKAGEVAEFLTYFPELRADIEAVLMRLDALIANVAADWAQHYTYIRKDFALAIKDRPWSAILFRMLSVTPTWRPGVASTPTAKEVAAHIKTIAVGLSVEALERMM